MFSNRLEEVNHAVEIVYGGYGYLVQMIDFLKVKYSNDAEYLFGRLFFESGVTDHAIICKSLLSAGFTDDEVLTALYRITNGDIITHVRKIYGFESLAEMAMFLSPFFKYVSMPVRIDDLARQNRDEFSGGQFRENKKDETSSGKTDDKTAAAAPSSKITLYELATAFEMMGFLSSRTQELQSYFINWMPRGIIDDELADHLGKKGLDLKVVDAVYILQNMGYDVVDAIKHLIQSGYTWAEFFEQVYQHYRRRDYKAEYGEIGSSAKFIVAELKGKYSARHRRRSVQHVRLSQSSLHIR